MLAPAGLTYPVVAKVFSATEGETFESNLRLSQSNGPLPPVKPPTARSGAVRRAVNSIRTTPSLAAQFQALPSVREGKVEHYDIQPALPKGMRMDTETGAISGLPEHRFTSLYQQTFEVFGYNSVGMCSCKVWLEIVGGNWNLVHIKLYTDGEREVLDGHNDSVEDSFFLDRFSEGGASISGASPLAMSRKSLFEGDGAGDLQTSPMLVSPTGRALEHASDTFKDDKDAVLATVKSHGNNPTPAYLNRIIPAKDSDWTSALDKVAVMLERFGTARMIREPAGVAGMKLVKGMTASALLPHLGLSDDPHNARTLVRLVDHRGRNRRDHPLGGAGSLGRGPGAEVAVASTDAMSANDAIVYLRPASILSLPAPPKISVPALSEISGMSWEPSAYRVASPREASTLRAQPPAGLTQYRQLDPKPPKPETSLGSARVRPPPPLLRSNLDRQPDSARRTAPEGEQISLAVNEEFEKLLPRWRAKLRGAEPAQARIDASRRWRVPT